MQYSRAGRSGEWSPLGRRWWEVWSTARRHRAVIPAQEAEIVLGVLGYPVAEEGSVPADEFAVRTRAWGMYDATADTGTLDWRPNAESVEAYRARPDSYSRAFSAFGMATRPLVPADRISWRARKV